MKKGNDIKVFISNRDSICDECGEELGRIGRSAAAKSLDEEAVRLAVIAHIRHAETNYDELLAMGYERREARDKVNEKVGDILTNWET